LIATVLCVLPQIPQPALADEAPNLVQIVRRTMEFYFETPTGSQKSLRNFIRDLPMKPQYKKSSGLFVTLSKSGRPRACWGSIYPEHPNLVEATVYATFGALTKDYRYKPIAASEWRGLKPQVTVITAAEPLSGIAGQNPLKDGLLVRAGGKSGVLLPGEVADATYQLVKCKLKAGIKAKEPCQLYRLKAQVYE